MYWVIGYNRQGKAVSHLLAGKSKPNAFKIKARMLRDIRIVRVEIRLR